MQRKKDIPKHHVLSKLNPFIDENGLMRVGGRIKNFNVPFSVKYPIILPNRNHITDQIIMNQHKAKGSSWRKYCHICIETALLYNRDKQKNQKFN